MHVAMVANICFSCQLNQHLKDGLSQQLLNLDEVSILGPDASPARGEETGDGDMEQQVGAESKMSFVVIRNWWFKAFFFCLFSLLCQDEKQRFSSVLLTARLLAKFLGFISFLPYHTSEPPSRDIREAAIILRSKVCLV